MLQTGVCDVEGKRIAECFSGLKGRKKKNYACMHHEETSLRDPRKERGRKLDKNTAMEGRNNAATRKYRAMA